MNATDDIKTLANVSAFLTDPGFTKLLRQIALDLRGLKSDEVEPYAAMLERHAGEADALRARADALGIRLSASANE